jgi:diphosphomevalonate decarboxylase
LTKTGNQAINPGSVNWQSPSNIALVKYWGKYGEQLPINPSISITLKESVSRTKIEFSQISTSNGPLIDFLFEGKPAPAFGERIQKFLQKQLNSYPFLSDLELKISSSNTFPHSSGIASSAAAFSALALGILEIGYSLYHEKIDQTFYKEASELARLGSGSASRSVYGGYVVWGEMKEFSEYSNRFAVPVQTKVHPDFQQMQDAILIVSAGVKKVGSSAGHQLMNNHAFAEARVQQANSHMLELHKVLENGDAERFIEIVENEALTLHGLMLSSNPGYFLFEPSTIRIIEEIRNFRNETKIPVCFTLDAGPNVHLLYPGQFRKQVVEWIEEKLTSLCANNRWIDDGIGEGPVDLG